MLPHTTKAKYWLYGCVTGLVRCAGKYIANDDYTNVSIIEMNKKMIERIAVFALAAFLVGYFVYQVAYGTNESSYKYGFGQGKDEFGNCQDFDADCNAAPDDCQPTVYESTNGDFNGVPVSPASVDVHNASYYYLHYYILKNEVMTNKTACIDGYSHAWENSCKQNGTACVFLFNNGFLPDGGVLRNYNNTWYRCDVFRTDNGLPCSDTGGTRSPIMYHNGTITNGTQYWHDDGRGGWFGWK